MLFRNFFKKSKIIHLDIFLRNFFTQIFFTLFRNFFKKSKIVQCRNFFVLFRNFFKKSKIVQCRNFFKKFFTQIFYTNFLHKFFYINLKFFHRIFFEIHIEIRLIKSPNLMSQNVKKIQWISYKKYNCIFFKNTIK